MRLTDKQKYEICRLYYSGEKNKSDIAKQFNVSHTAISKILNDDKVSESFKSLIDETKTENALSMLAFIESKRTIAQDLITVALDSMKSKIAKASLRDTVGMIEKLSTVFKDSEDGGSEDEQDGTINIIFADCSGKGGGGNE